MDVGNATIIAAAIAAAVSLGSSVFAWCAANKSNKAAAQSNEVTNRTNREIAVFEQDEENKRNESQIDANIVWSARVEWIQNVRRATADLLTAINNYIYSDENDVDLVKMNLMSVREKSNLLILYFGPDKVENDKVDLLNKGDNISKNQHIVKLIEDIYIGCCSYFINIKTMKTCNDLDSLCKSLVLCQDLVQVKMRNFSDFNPPEAQPQCVFFHTLVRIHLVTYSYNGYEFVSYCRKLPDIRKSSGMPACNREF